MSRTTKALLASLTLHAALLWTVVSIRGGDDGRLSSPSPIVRVALVRMPGAAPSAPEAAVGEAPAAAPTLAAEPEPASTTPGRETREDAPAAIAAAQSPAATPRIPQSPAATPPAAERAPQPRAAQTARPALATATANATESRAQLPMPEGEAPSTAPVTEAPAPEQRRMLDDKAAEWAASLSDGGLASLAPSAEWTHDGQDYRATFTHVPAADSLGLEHVVAAVSTQRNGSRWSTEMRLQRLAFSSFAQLIDRWDPNVQIHDDEIDGRFHSNSEIFISSSGGVQPAFHGKVTTSRGINTSNSRRRVVRSEVFLGGLETRARRILLPNRFLPTPGDGAIGEERVHEFTADARITFYSDGTYGWAYVESAAPEQRVALSAEPHFLVGASQAALYVQGVIDGKVLAYSPEAIVIEDDLIYAADPEVNDDADDYLGLVSDKNVEIAAPATTGPGDLTVHASIYAKRRFIVRDYRLRDDATLSIYGSVAAGALSATEPRFRTKLKFDPRLENTRPPGFPMTDRFEIAAWNSDWALESDAD